MLKNLYPPDSSKDPTTDGGRISSALATHALVFQVTATGRTGKRMQRVVGVHPVRNCTADLLHRLFWDTVANLKRHAKLSVVAAVCDVSKASAWACTSKRGLMCAMRVHSSKARAPSLQRLVPIVPCECAQHTAPHTTALP